MDRIKINRFFSLIGYTWPSVIYYQYSANVRYFHHNRNNILLENWKRFLSNTWHNFVVHIKIIFQNQYGIISLVWVGKLNENNVWIRKNEFARALVKNDFMYFGFYAHSRIHVARDRYVADAIIQGLPIEILLCDPRYCPAKFLITFSLVHDTFFSVFCCWFFFFCCFSPVFHFYRRFLHMCTISRGKRFSSFIVEWNSRGVCVYIYVESITAMNTSCFIEKKKKKIVKNRKGALITIYREKILSWIFKRRLQVFSNQTRSSGRNL